MKYGFEFGVDGIYLKQDIVPLLEAFALQEVSQLWFEMDSYSKETP